MKLEYNATAYLLIVENLVNSLGSDGEYEEALKLAEEAPPLAYRMQRPYTVSSLLYEIAWNTEQKMEQDPGRTSCHDSVIVRFNQLARYLQSHGKAAAWRDTLGYEEEDRYFRKRIGDFACYLAFVNSLLAR